MFDEQLPSQRLSRGNFGLTWFMCKGANNGVYARWCRMATMMWPEFAAKLEEESGYYIELEWNGGAMHALDDEQFRAYGESVDAITKVCAEEGLDYPVRMLDRAEFGALVPKMQLGEEVTGAMYSAEQGHVNPLPLLAAMRYDQLPEHKNIYFLAGHSAVSLAPLKANQIASWILGNEEVPQISHFSNGRFNV